MPKVGDAVTARYGMYTVRGTVIEDRGNVGMGGRRMFRIHVDVGGDAEPLDFEIPADDISSVQHKSA